MKKPKIKIYIPEFTAKEQPIGATRVPAGFPSPAADYEEERIDLNKILIMNPSSTFYAIVEGESMKDEGINDGDLLVVDRSLEPNANDIVLCFLNGEFTLKKIKFVDEQTVFLMPENPDFEPIKVSVEEDFRVWGVLTCSIKKHSRWLHW